MTIGPDGEGPGMGVRAGESNGRRVAVLIGTRPEAVKMAPVVDRLRRSPGWDPVVVSSGQHREMLAQIAEVFSISIDHQLDAMRPGQSLASLTARVIEQVDTAIESIQPDMVLVQGDTTTVMAASLASFYRGVPVGHIEAGLRTGNLRSPFPEEANRKLTSQVASLHFTPTDTAAANLEAEGVDPAIIHVTGNTVVDALLSEIDRQADDDYRAHVVTTLAATVGADWDAHPTVLITGHRRENLGDGLDQICEAIARLADLYPDHRFVYPVHLNPLVQRPVHARLGSKANVVLTPPLDYSAFVMLMNRSVLVLTDSGGIQEEAPTLNKPVLIMRDTTERPEGLAAGTARLVGSDAGVIVDHVAEVLDDEGLYSAMAAAPNPFGDGRAAARIVKLLAEYLG